MYVLVPPFWKILLLNGTGSALGSLVLGKYLAQTVYNSQAIYDSQTGVLSCILYAYMYICVYIW